jgi:hypothetical protein
MQSNGIKKKREHRWDVTGMQFASPMGVGLIWMTTLTKRNLTRLEQRHELASKSVTDMRTSFQTGNWNETLLTYGKFKNIRAGKGLRVEAASLAVRALAAKGDRRAAREILKAISDTDYLKANHYAFLAQACLALKHYKAAAQACEHAEILRIAEDEAKKTKALAVEASPESAAYGRMNNARSADGGRRQFR